VAQNDRLVVVLTVTEREKRRGSLMLVDHLPAGLEIDNPNLVDSGKVESAGLAEARGRAGDPYRIPR
jgi:alpha-2-macroglobulin